VTSPSLQSPVDSTVLHLDPVQETERIAEAIREQVFGQLRRKGVVLGLSGGIDSSVTAALCVRALGTDRVLGLLMPEHDSSPESFSLGHLLAEHYGINTLVEDIAATLEAAGCYSRRDQAIRSVFPEYGPGYKAKIVLPGLFDSSFRLFSVVVESPTGEVRRARLPLSAYQQLVAATSFKQRVRKMMEYYHADRLRYAVVGTPNRLEYELGFFVKLGDGAADIKPIAHLYKTQVYQLAEYLEVPEAIRRRPPTTDTYSMSQSQEEFFFALPYDKMDLCLYGKNQAIPAEELAPAVGLSAKQGERVFEDIDAKHNAARYLHQCPLLVDPVINESDHS